MHKVALLNGKVSGVNDASISAVSAAALYGHGVFTTIAIYSGESFLLEKHWRRLMDNASKLGIAVEVSFEEIKSWLDELIAANNVDDGRARITLLDSGGAGLWTERSVKRTEILIVTGERFKRPDVFRLTTSPYAINSSSPLAGVKSCNYLEHLIAYEDAKRRGFDEAIRLNERGEVTSATMANVFWLRDEKLFTPSLDTGCLAGTTREFILENLNVEKVCRKSDELFSADAMFICSAGVGVKQIGSLNDKSFNPIDHEILHVLAAEHKNTNVREVSPREHSCS